MSGLPPAGSGSSHSAHGSSGHTATKTEKLSFFGLILACFLTITLIGLGQRGLYDVNRVFNPHYTVCNQKVVFTYENVLTCPTSEYALKTVLLHSYVTFPLFAIFFILALILRKRKLNSWQRALFRVSGIISIFFGLEFLLEVVIYLFKYYKTIGWYFTLGMTALLIVILLVYIEHKHSLKKAAAHGH